MIDWTLYYLNNQEMDKEMYHRPITIDPRLCAQTVLDMELGDKACVDPEDFVVDRNFCLWIDADMPTTDNGLVSIERTTDGVIADFTKLYEDDDNFLFEQQMTIIAYTLLPVEKAIGLINPEEPLKPKKKGLYLV